MNRTIIGGHVRARRPLQPPRCRPHRGPRRRSGRQARGPLRACPDHRRGATRWPSCSMTWTAGVLLSLDGEALRPDRRDRRRPERAASPTGTRSSAPSVPDGPGRASCRVPAPACSRPLVVEDEEGAVLEGLLAVGWADEKPPIDEVTDSTPGHRRPSGRGHPPGSPAQLGLGALRPRRPPAAHRPTDRPRQPGHVRAHARARDRARHAPGHAARRRHARRGRPDRHQPS